VANNPTNYVDPTGHFFDGAIPGCGLSGGCGGGGGGGGGGGAPPPNIVEVTGRPRSASQPVNCNISTGLIFRAGPVWSRARYDWVADGNCFYSGAFIVNAKFRATLIGWDDLGTFLREAEDNCLDFCSISKKITLHVGRTYSISACLPFSIQILSARGTEWVDLIGGNCGMGAIYLERSGHVSWALPLRPVGS